MVPFPDGEVVLGREIEPRVWLKYQKLREGGMSRAASALEAGISYTMASRFDRGEIRTDSAQRAVNALEVIQAASDVRPPVPLEELGEEARAALHDFDLFRKRYLGRRNKPWQSRAAAMVVELEATDQKEWVVVNVPPGSGKSTTFTHDIPAWLIVRGRVLGLDVRLMFGSRTQRQANQYGRRLRATLMRPRPVEGADAVLVDDYGQFQPTNHNLWRAEEFIVWENPEEQPTDEKEPTVMCAGMDTGFLGGRFNFVIWDDLVDASTIRTDDARKRQREWFDDEAETRLEPGGLFLLQGQRLSPDDLYRYALDKPGVKEDGTLDPDSSKYKHVVFPAHDESRCNDEHSRNAPAWPEGCLLDPERLTWRDLMAIKENNPRRFDIIMQQKDVDPSGSLVPRVFIEGGMWNGLQLPGCLDMDRSLCELGLSKDNLVSAISVDPSPTKFWSVQWWVYDPDTELRWLMDLHRGAMDAPDFLDRLANGQFTGIANDWVLRAAELGHPVTTMIVEQNAAQRFLLQYDHVQEWMAGNGLSVIPHNTTHSNKSDESFGVQTLRPQYQYGRVRIPYGDVYARSVVDDLIKEVTVWPDGRTDDCVMAQWMFEWNLPNLTAASASVPTRRGIPSWVSGR